MKNIFYLFLIIITIIPSSINSQNRRTKPETPIREPRNNLNERTNIEQRSVPIDETKERNNIKTKIVERENPTQVEIFEQASEPVEQIVFIEVTNSIGGYCGGSNLYQTEKPYTENISEIEFYNNAIENFSEDTTLYFLRGVVKNKLEDYSGAIEDFSIYLKAFPKDEKAYYQRGLAYLFNLDRNSAFSDFQFSYYLGSEESENILKKYF